MPLHKSDCFTNKIEYFSKGKSPFHYMPTMQKDKEDDDDPSSSASSSSTSKNHGSSKRNHQLPASTTDAKFW
jgi:hypothetical protein